MSSSLNPSRSFHSSIDVRPGCVHQSIQSNSRLVQIQLDEGIDANGRVDIGRGSGVCRQSRVASSRVGVLAGDRGMNQRWILIRIESRVETPQAKGNETKPTSRTGNEAKEGIGTSQRRREKEHERYPPIRAEKKKKLTHKETSCFHTGLCGLIVAPSPYPLIVPNSPPPGVVAPFPYIGLGVIGPSLSSPLARP